MRRALILLALCGCATSGADPDDTTPRQATILAGDASNPTLLAERPRAVGTTIAAPPAAVWLAAKKVYLELEVPLAVENPSTHQMGNPNFYRSHQFAGRSMTDLVDCGNGMTGPKASSYRIYMSLLTDIVTDGHGGTKIQTTFVPMGQDLTGNATDRIVCASTGRMEKLFLDRVQLAIGKA